MSQDTDLVAVPQNEVSDMFDRELARVLELSLEHHAFAEEATREAARRLRK